MSESILKAEHLNRFFGALHAASDVSFKVSDGQMRAMIGPNDAGKSTLMDLICNRTAPSNGEVIFRRKDIAGLAPHKIARKGMCKCSQVTQTFLSLTVYGNVQITRVNMNKETFHLLPIKDTHPEGEVMKYLAMVGIEDKTEEIAGLMSYGNQRELDVVITLALEPKLLILDEPAVGVAKKEACKLVGLVRKLGKEQHTTITLIEHDMETMFNYTDEISVMSNGTLITSNTPERIGQNEFVQQAYLEGAE